MAMLLSFGTLTLCDKIKKIVKGQPSANLVQAFCWPRTSLVLAHCWPSAVLALAQCYPSTSQVLAQYYSQFTTAITNSIQSQLFCNIVYSTFSRQVPSCILKSVHYRCKFLIITTQRMITPSNLIKIRVNTMIIFNMFLEKVAVNCPLQSTTDSSTMPNKYI